MNEGCAKAANLVVFGRERGCRNVTLSPWSWQDGAVLLAMKLSSSQAICRFPFAGVLPCMLLHVLSTEHGNVRRAVGMLERQLFPATLWEGVGKLEPGSSWTCVGLG